MCSFSYLTILVLMSTIVCFDTTTITWHDKVYTITGPTTLTWNSKGTTTRESVNSTQVGSYYYYVTTPIRTTSGLTVFYRDSSTYVETSRSQPFSIPSSNFEIIEPSSITTSRISFVSSVSSYSSLNSSQSILPRPPTSSNPTITTSSILSTVSVLTSSSIPSRVSSSSTPSSYSNLNSAQSIHTSSSLRSSASSTDSSTTYASSVHASSLSSSSLFSSSSSTLSTLSSISSSFHSTSLLQSTSTPSLSSTLNIPLSSSILSTFSSSGLSSFHSRNTGILSGRSLSSCLYNMVSTYDTTKSIPTAVIVLSKTYTVATYTVLTIITTKSHCSTSTPYKKASLPVTTGSTPISFTRQTSTAISYSTSGNPTTLSSTSAIIVSFPTDETFATTSNKFTPSTSDIHSYSSIPAVGISPGTSSAFYLIESSTKNLTTVLTSRFVSSAKSTSHPISTISNLISNSLRISHTPGDSFSNSSLLPVSLWTTRTYSAFVTITQASGQQLTITTFLTLTTTEPCYSSDVSTRSIPVGSTTTQPFSNGSPTSSRIGSTASSTNSTNTELSITGPNITEPTASSISEQNATVRSIDTVTSSGHVTSLSANKPETGLGVTGYYTEISAMGPIHSSSNVFGTTEPMVPSTTLDNSTLPTTSMSLPPILSAASISSHTIPISGTYSVSLVANQAVKHTIGGAVVVVLIGLL